MRSAIGQPGAAELNRGVRYPPPEWPDRGRDPKFDAGARMPASKIVDHDLSDRFDWLVRDPVAAHLMRPESTDRQPVGVEPAIPKPLQPAALHDVDPPGRGLPEESFPVLGRGGRDRPDTATRAVPGKPEHRRMPAVDRPHHRRSVRIGSRPMRPEPAEGRILAEVPESERPFAVIGWRGLTRQQLLRVIGIHAYRVQAEHLGKLPDAELLTRRRSHSRLRTRLACAARPGRAQAP